MEGMAENKLVFLIGFMGVGKSYLARELAKRMDFAILDLDHEIEDIYDDSIVHIFREKGEQYFREIEHNALKMIIQQGGNKIISCGGGTPCFHDNMELMNVAGLTIFISKEIPDILSNVLRGIQKRPLLADKSRKEIESYIAHTLEVRRKYYIKAKLIVHDYHDQELVHIVRQKIKAHFNPELIQ